MTENLTAPMPGTLISVMVREGQLVEEGQPLLVMEAMKMEHTITASHAGVVKRLPFASGATVAGGVTLVELEEGNGERLACEAVMQALDEAVEAQAAIGAHLGDRPIRFEPACGNAEAEVGQREQRQHRRDVEASYVGTACLARPSVFCAPTMVVTRS